MDYTTMEPSDVFVGDNNKLVWALDTRLCLPTQRGFTVLKLEEIVYCEARGSYTFFRLVDNKSILISRPLSDYEKLLTDGSFSRVHKSFLVNLMHIKEYNRSNGGRVIMTNGTEVEVSRGQVRS